MVSLWCLGKSIYYKGEMVLRVILSTIVFLVAKPFDLKNGIRVPKLDYMGVVGMT